MKKKLLLIFSIYCSPSYSMASTQFLKKIAKNKPELAGHLEKVEEIDLKVHVLNNQITSNAKKASHLLMQLAEEKKILDSEKILLVEKYLHLIASFENKTISEEELITRIKDCKL